MKIEDSRVSVKATTIRMTLIPENTVFTGVIGGTCSTFVKAFERVIDLADAGNTWHQDTVRSPVKNYAPRDAKVVLL